MVPYKLVELSGSFSRIAIRFASPSICDQRVFFILCHRYSADQLIDQRADGQRSRGACRIVCRSIRPRRLRSNSQKCPAFGLRVRNRGALCAVANAPPAPNTGGGDGGTAATGSAAPASPPHPEQATSIAAEAIRQDLRIKTVFGNRFMRHLRERLEAMTVCPRSLFHLAQDYLAKRLRKQRRMSALTPKAVIR